MCCVPAEKRQVLSRTQDCREQDIDQVRKLLLSAGDLGDVRTGTRTLAHNVSWTET